MTCLGCTACESHPVTLASGVTVCAYCPEWRAECEARSVRGMDKEQRDKYLRTVSDKRGRDAAMALWNAMKAITQK